MLPTPELRLEMLLDDETFTAATGQQPAWVQEPWHPDGLHPTFFGTGGVPLKHKSMDHEIALKHFQIALDANRVRGPPTYLLQVTMAIKEKK